MESASWSNSNSAPTTPESTSGGELDPLQASPARVSGQPQEMLDSPPSDVERLPDVDVDEGAVIEEGEVAENNAAAIETLNPAVASSSGNFNPDLAIQTPPSSTRKGKGRAPANAPTGWTSEVQAQAAAGGKKEPLLDEALVESWNKTYADILDRSFGAQPPEAPPISSETTK